MACNAMENAAAVVVVIDGVVVELRFNIAFVILSGISVTIAVYGVSLAIWKWRFVLFGDI